MSKVKKGKSYVKMLISSTIKLIKSMRIFKSWNLYLIGQTVTR